MDSICVPGFEPVREKLRKVIRRAPAGGGAALCVYYQGRCVVDIWGGSCNSNLDFWQRDTLAMSFSTTKGIVSTLVHILADRGLLSYEDRVCQYWPEFAENGKDEITIRQLLCHEGGLYDIASMVDEVEEVYDWEHMVNILAKATPSHVPGESHGYHGLTYGWLIGELIQRITQKKLAQVLDEELVQPLKLDGLYIGLPEEQLPRVAQLITHEVMRDGFSKPLRSFLHLQNMFLRTVTGNKINFDRLRDALLLNRYADVDESDPRFMQACIPAANGIFTARSLARVYGCLANGGELDNHRLLSRAAIDRATKPQNKGLDRVVFLPMGWRLGYHSLFCPGFKMTRAFGHFGFGGSGAWADPRRNLALGMIVNTGVGTPFGDIRIFEISRTVLQCAEKVGDYKVPMLAEN